MTYERREEIFSKEALNVHDMMELFDISESAAYTVIRNIKVQVGDRLGVQGRVHIQDFLDYFRVPTADRYAHLLTDKDADYGVGLKKSDLIPKRFCSVMDPRGGNV